MRVLATLDKFRGTASAAEAASAVSAACWELGFDCREVPMSDGGEGILDVLGGPNRTATVTGPLGRPVDAAWGIHGRVAIIEMARASGLVLAGGARGNDPLGATTAGTGELVERAIESGARTVIVGLGGSATTDGGLGAVEVLRSPARFGTIELRVACDVRTPFLDAAAVFAPQKGASPAVVSMLTARLHQLADRYERDFGVDVRPLEGGGAAGGLAGGLAALGARLLGGFDLVADHVDLDDRVAEADLVVTGEGHLDAQSLDGKVVGGVCEVAVAAATPVLVIVGSADAEARATLEATATASAPITVIDLVATFGTDQAFTEPLRCIEQATRTVLTAL